MSENIKRKCLFLQFIQFQLFPTLFKRKDLAFQMSETNYLLYSSCCATHLGKFRDGICQFFLLSVQNFLHFCPCLGSCVGNTEEDGQKVDSIADFVEESFGSLAASSFRKY